MSVQPQSEPTRIIIQQERAPSPIREYIPRGRKEKFDLDAIIFPALVIGGLVAFAMYREPIKEFIEDFARKATGREIKDLLDRVLPPPEPQPDDGDDDTTGAIIFDSNRHWVGRAGQTVDGKFGNTGPNGKGFYTAASGNPKLRFVTPTEYELIGSGSGIHPRIYGAVNNYNARLQFEFKFNSGNVENISFKIRNRHDRGGSCENRVGGFGGHISRSEAGLKIEKCHNTHENGVERGLPQKLSNGTWYKVALTVQDTSQGILQKVDLNGREVVRDVYKGSYKPYFDKALFEKHSEFWIRYNGGSGSVSFKNVTVRALGSTASANLAVAMAQRITIA